MKISCELPNCLLNQNNEINDYDFILFHLFQNNKTYRNFFIENKKENRLTILDNSAYEFYINGQQLDEKAFIKAIKLLNPTYFIVNN